MPVARNVWQLIAVLMPASEGRRRTMSVLTKIGNHLLRATGITDYLKSDGSLSEARKMAHHADTRTAQLGCRLA
jgi:hypothetical protein